MRGGGASFFARGKLLLSGEYFVMDGTQALALPTRFGQHMEVTYEGGQSPSLLFWKGLDENARVWFESCFELRDFSVHKKTSFTGPELFLRKLLGRVRKQNPDFLRGESGAVHVETRLEFPLEWGLGSSSTLISNLSRWASVSPFQLQSEVLGGSGYDIACAQVGVSDSLR